MELSKEQIQRVEHYLNVKDITYIDLRMEVLDHIISDIEAKMKKEDLDFETIFYNVTDKWNKHLDESSSWLFGLTYSAPKIVMDKAKKSFLKWFLLLPILGFTPFLLLDKLNFFLSVNIIDRINLSFQIITVLCSSFFVFLLLTKAKSKIKTTYSFILNTQKFNFSIGVFLFLDFNFINKEGIINNSQTGLLFVYILASLTYFHFLKKHKEAIKKHKIS
jgi:hypothetical protein